MDIKENFRLALQALRTNLLRAALTMLGIMIGVAAVITLLALGDGVTRFVADQFIGLGSNLVFIVPPGGPESGGSQTLTVRDAEMMADPVFLSGVAEVAPLLFTGATFQYQGNEYRTTVRGTTPGYGPMRGYEVARGRFITDEDYNNKARVVVLGLDTVEGIFPVGVDPLGEMVKIKGLNFQVVGILASRGGSGFGNDDEIAVVPLTTMHERLKNARDNRTGERLVDIILVQALDSDAVQNIVLDVSELLRVNHEIQFRGEDDFLVLTQQDFLSAFGEVTAVLTLFLGAIASISLLVGGIGIMNIMLVSVTERTREIGLRKAVGAKYRDILGQFLTEALLMSVIGGTLGILLGYIGAAVIHWYVPNLDTTITWEAVLLAVGFSVGVGLFFGIYPAAQAASLNPIDALRFE